MYQRLHYFKNFEKSVFYNYFHYFWILLIGSNHGRRYDLYLKKKLNIICTTRKNVKKPNLFDLIKAINLSNKKFLLDFLEINLSLQILFK